MSTSRKESLEALLKLQIVHCAKSLGGKSKSAVNNRNRISSTEVVEIPQKLLVEPAPIEVVKTKEVEVEVVKEVPVPGPSTGISLAVTVTSVVVSTCIGLAAGVAFF